jgi:hypothetical protein
VVPAGWSSAHIAVGNMCSYISVEERVGAPVAEIHRRFDWREEEAT